MNIAVCMKVVPDTETKIKLKSPQELDLASAKFIINPYDEYALEEAIKIKEKLGGTVTLYIISNYRADEVMQTALAMGADSAVLLKDPALEGSDAQTLALVLSRMAGPSKPDLVLTGNKAIDDDSHQVTCALAEFLGLPSVNLAVKIEVAADKKSLRVRRQVEGGEEVVNCSLPAVVSAQKGLNQPRYPTLVNIMKAKKKPVKAVTLQSLGLKPSDVGAAASGTKVVEYTQPAPRKGAKLVQYTTPAEAAAALFKLLKEEAKAL